MWGIMPNFNRKDMPQVSTQNMSKALDRVADKVRVSKESIRASKLKKSQKELYKDKVKGIASKFSSPNSMKPLVISKDNHIVDGHHRWAAAIYKWGEDVKIPVHRINLSAVNAIKLYSMIAKSIGEMVSELKEGMWSKSALAAFHRKPMPGRYFISDENGNVVEKGLKTRRSWVAFLHNMGKMGGSLSYHGIPKVVNIHDGKKDNEVVDQYYWRDKYGKGRYSIDIDEPTAGSHSKIDPKLVNYKEIEKQLGLKEAINIPIEIGDTVLGGKFKNKPIVVKSIDKNEKGDITINGKPLLKFRLMKEGNDQLEMMKLLSKAMKVMPGSPKQKKIKQELNKLRIKNGLEPIPEGLMNEIPMDDLQKIDTFADKKLNPVDVVITDKHFFDRLNDPRNGKEITSAELIGFFKRLSKHKKEFVDFLNKYNSVVAVDDRTNINIPFMKQANKAIAKTVMRKKDFKTPNQKLDI